MDTLAPILSTCGPEIPGEVNRPGSDAASPHPAAGKDTVFSPEAAAQVDAQLAAAGSRAGVFLVGAGGCGMSGLGHLLLDLGNPVAGSDLVLNAATEGLRRRGATVYTGHDAEHLRQARPALVVYSSAVSPGNPELTAARELGIPTVRRAVLLAALLRRQKGICVAGMHGKTTTSAMLALALDKLGAHPSYAVGAVVPQLTPHARLVAQNNVAGFEAGEIATARTRGWFVIEADESDGSLAVFRPEHAILLNVDEEHLDYYANLDAVCREFEEFAGQTRGLVVYCADDPHLTRPLQHRPGAVSFGYAPEAAYRIERPPAAPPPGRLSPPLISGSEFRVCFEGKCLGLFRIPLVGDQNVSNATAVIALLHQLGFVPEAIGRAVALFQGAERRQQVLFGNENCRVMEDYGHHPREIAATLRALKSLGWRRLLVAFQPHRFTRTQRLLPRFAACFQEADRLWLTDIYAASEPPITGVNGPALAQTIRDRGQSVEYVASLDGLADSVQKAMQPGDLVVFLGAGSITQAAHQLADRLPSSALVCRPLTGAALPPIAPPAREMETDWDGLTRQLSPQTVWRRHEPLAKHTTLRVGGDADFWVEPATETELALVLEFGARHRLPCRLVGRGSNLLVKDTGLRGLVICLAHPGFGRIEHWGTRICCGAGARLKRIVLAAKQGGLGGFEFLEGIPGTLGGALHMNAGAMGASLFDIVERIRFMDFSGQVFDREGRALSATYRRCDLLAHHIALESVLTGSASTAESIENTRRAFSEKRRRSQPAGPSAGCIFKNPTSIPAGKLIEELGLKGARVGGAVISEVHANFIVNAGHATAQDILSLIDLVRERARVERGIELETEVQIMGD